MKNIMIIAAHPDDEILGCGGTVARLIKEGCEGRTLVLGEGLTSRGKSIPEETLALYKAFKDANIVIGVTKMCQRGLPDNEFDTVPLLEIVKLVKSEIDDFKPDTIFTHFRGDLNIDHRITYQAVITATRPMMNESVKEIYSFEVLSSTEWNYPTTFSPDTFYDITDTMNDKLQALGYYESEMKDNRHPRSMTGVWNNAKMWGLKSGLEYAEAFETVRRIL